MSDLLGKKGQEVNTEQPKIKVSLLLFSYDDIVPDGDG